MEAFGAGVGGIAVTYVVLLLVALWHAFRCAVGVVARLTVTALVIEHTATDNGFGAEFGFEISVVEVDVECTFAVGRTFTVCLAELATGLDRVTIELEAGHSLLAFVGVGAFLANGKLSDTVA